MNKKTTMQLNSFFSFEFARFYAGFYWLAQENLYARV